MCLQASTAQLVPPTYLQHKALLAVLLTESYFIIYLHVRRSKSAAVLGW